MIGKCIQALKKYALSHAANVRDGESILTLLYEAYSEVNRMDDDQIKADFNALYAAMNGITLREMDQVIYPLLPRKTKGVDTDTCGAYKTVAFGSLYFIGAIEKMLQEYSAQE